MTASLLPNAEQQFNDEAGIPYAGGFVYSYVPGTTTLKDTFQDADGTTLNTNPIILDAAGRAIIFGTGDYRQVLFDVQMNMIWDQLTSAPLPDDAISAAMAPVVAASTLAQARDLMGITAAINAAVSAVQLIPGAIGPTGPTGAASTIPGPTGPTGPAGSSTTVGAGLYTGFATTDANGFINITFATPFSNAITAAYPSLWTVPTSTGLLSSFSVLSGSVSGFQMQVYDNLGNPLPSTVIVWTATGY